MLRLRIEQQESIATTLFAQRLARHWSSSFSKEFAGINNDAIQKLAVSVIEAAQNNYIENEADIILWADLCLVNKSGFAVNLDLLKNQHGRY